MFDSFFDYISEQANFPVDKVSLYVLLYIWACTVLGSLCDFVLALFPFGEFSPCCSSLFIH